MKTKLKKYEVRIAYTQYSKGTVFVMAKNAEHAEEIAEVEFENGNVETEPFDGHLETISVDKI